MAAASIGGRAVPLLWVGYSGASPRRSQDSPEERLLRKLRALIPKSAPMTILADRGFGRSEWAAACLELEFHYVVRIKLDVTIPGGRYRVMLKRYPTKNDMANRLRNLDYHKGRRVEHNVVIRWRPDLPKERDEPWFLMTDLDRKAERLCDLCGRRMSIEELFRDHKSRRNGQSLRNTRIGKADRFIRFPLVVTLACIVLVGLVLRAKLD